MKQRFFSGLTAIFLSLLICYGALGCLASVYYLVFSPGLPILVCLSAAILAAVLLPRRHGPTVLLCLAALALGFACTLPEALAQAKGLLIQISTLLDGVYHWGYLDFPGQISGTAEIPVSIYGGALTLLLCRTLLRRKSCLLPLCLCLPCLILCGMMTAFPPAPAPLFCWIAGIMLLLLSAAGWRNAASQGRSLTALCLIPVLLLCALLFWRNPQEGYHDHAESLRARYLALLENRLPQAQTPAAFVPQVRRTADLAGLTGGNQHQLPVLVVTSPVSGDLYLRGQDFETYTGLGWQAEENRVEAFSGWGDSAGEISIRTFALQSVLYLPYFPGSGTVLTGGALENNGGILSYSFPVCPQGSAADGQTLSACLQLPEATAGWAKGFQFAGSTPGEIADSIGTFVRGSARYDLATGQMPETEQDFAKWFLEDSDSGYCVHFATAAVVLLRGQGIPARYVTGFRCEAAAGEAQVLTTLEAHAWAEYYDSQLGSWRILEATAQGHLPRPEPTTAPTVTEALPTATTTAPRTPSTDTAAPAAGGHMAAWLLAAAAMLLLLPLRRLTFLAIRRRRREKASLNRRCLLWWQEAERLSRALKQEPPEALLNLAQRACYSQHRLTPPDLAPMTDYCAQCREALDRQRPLKRWLQKYILVLY